MGIPNFLDEMSGFTVKEGVDLQRVKGQDNFARWKRDLPDQANDALPTQLEIFLPKSNRKSCSIRRTTTMSAVVYEGAECPLVL